MAFGLRGGSTTRNRRYEGSWLFPVCVVVLSAVVGGLLTVLPYGSIARLPRTDTLITGIWAVPVAVACLVRAFSGTSERPLSRALPLVFAAHLALGLFAFDVLSAMKHADWPIAGVQKMPAGYAVEYAFWVDLACIAILISITRIRVARRKRPFEALGWGDALLLGQVLAVLGGLGVAIVFVKTRTVPLFAHNIDTLRFNQGSGLGYASLLEYELLAAALIGFAGVVVAGGHRRPGILLGGSCLLTLLIFRVERTPLVVAALAAAFAALYSNRSRLRIRVAVTLGLAGAVAVLLIGAVRFASQGQASGRETEARLAFDVAPEFREQAWIYQLYPDQAPFLGSAAVKADASSIVPSRFLRILGSNKAQIYGDISHQYVGTMSALGYYPANVKPLRVGFAGEMWADFGWPGLIFGFIGLGLLAVAVDAMEVNDAVSLARKSGSAAIVVLAVVQPLGSLLPLALMTIAPLAVLPRLLLSRRDSISSERADPMTEV